MNEKSQTTPKCPFCGGTMLPLKYCADSYGNMTYAARLYYQDGWLKACSQCGIVKFYPDEKEE